MSNPYKRGGAYEPYCSEECYESGGNTAMSGMERGGPCMFCRQPVAPFSGLFVAHQHRVAVICRDCKEKGKHWIAAMDACTWCGKSL